MRLARLTIAAALGFAASGTDARAQVPAGFPYTPGLHPNPIVTFATDTDFRTVSYEVAREEAGIELLGLSARVGTREDVAVTRGEVQEVEILDRDTEVLFFPAVRQRFRLTDDRVVTLYSFRDPRPGEIPADVLVEVLNRHAFRPDRKPEDARFGPHPGPEDLEVRGVAALMFSSGDHTPLTVFWQENGVSHVATSDALGHDELFRVIEDLL